MRYPHEPADSGLAPAADPRWIPDSLIGITEIRRIFKLGRTAAYELTHRPGFPDPVLISPRCYRWWASEVMTFAASLRQESARSRAQPAAKLRPPDAAVPQSRITGKVRAARTHRKAS